MAVFSNIDIASLTVEASRRNKVAVETQLQPYNDFLFNIISTSIKARHDDIMQELRQKIQCSGGEVRKVDAYLWHYNVRYFNISAKEYANKLHALPAQDQYNKHMEGVARDAVYNSNGWHWKIGAEFDGMIDSTNWPQIYDNLPMVPVDLVMRKTDLLARLSTHFHDCGWVEREVGKIVHEDETCQVRTIILKVQFYPKGVPGGYRGNALQAAMTKYANHTDYKVQDDHRVVLRGPGLAPPRTPAQQDTPPVTPGAPRRRRCPTCDGVEIMTYDSE